METRHNFEYRENKSSLRWSFFTAISPLILSVYFHFVGRLQIG